MADYMNGEDNRNVELTGIFKQGYGYIPKSIMIFKGISIQAKAVYAFIASFAGKKGTAFPSRETMCKYLNISQDSINKYLKELVKYDLIKKEKQRQQGNKFANNLYTINYDLELNNEPIQENSVTENKGTPMQEFSVTEEHVNVDTDNEKSVYNNNSNNNNNNNNNNILDNNRENKNSLQFFKSLIDKYFTNSSNNIKQLVSEHLELKDKKGKLFKDEKQFSHYADSLNFIKDEDDKWLCLNYSLKNNYPDIYPERFKNKDNNKNKVDDNFNHNDDEDDNFNYNDDEDDIFNYNDDEDESTYEIYVGEDGKKHTIIRGGILDGVEVIEN